MFDGITYAKGGAVLKQLMFLTGEDGFSKGLQKYFDRFKWSNATIYDFLDDMKNYFPPEIDLEEWTKSWLEASSLNVFEVIWDPTDLSSAASLQLHQKAYYDNFNTLRWHKLEVTLFGVSGNIL
jgi:aminopeptidase N